VIVVVDVSALDQRRQQHVNLGHDVQLLVDQLRRVAELHTATRPHYNRTRQYNFSRRESPFTRRPVASPGFGVRGGTKIEAPK